MPGGNTRTVIHVAPFPLTIAQAAGATITDVDDHVYADFLGEYTAGLYGHSHPIILGAVREALADGICFGAPNEYEAGLAAAVCARFPSIDLVRFTNSGTEANMLAISLARAHTGREAIMVFEGGYHGGVFFYATAAGSPINAPFPTVMGAVQRRGGRGAPDRRERRTRWRPSSSSRCRAAPAASRASRLPAGPARRDHASTASC